MRRDRRNADKNRTKKRIRWERDTDDAPQKECTSSAGSRLEADDLPGVRKKMLGQAAAGGI